MNESGTVILLVILTVLAVILLNFLLVASVKSGAKRTNAKTLRKMFKAVQDPFRETHSEMDELSDLMEQVKKAQEESDQ